jgi:hypothetical protein
MRPPRFDLRVAVGRNLTLTSLSLPLTRQDHDKTPVAVGGHLRALDMWIGRNAIHGSTFWSSRSRRKPGLTHTASRSQARITLNDLSRATSLAARVVAPLSAAGTTIESVERQSDAGDTTPATGTSTVPNSKVTQVGQPQPEDWGGRFQVSLDGTGLLSLSQTVCSISSPVAFESVV